MKGRIYIPNTLLKRGSTIGESHFLKSKVWKLLAMFGEDWTTNGWTLRGFTIWNINGRKYFEEVTSYLDKHGIAYKVDQSVWQTRINISTRKKNLEIIDRLYGQWKEDTLLEAMKSGDYWVKDNFIYSTKEMERFISNVEDSYPNIRDYFVKLTSEVYFTL